MEEKLNFASRVKSAWNAFFNKDPTKVTYQNMGPGYSIRPDRIRLTRGNERSIITSIYNRISLDVSNLEFKHCRIDKDGRFDEEIKSGLNYCLNVEANIDQTGRAFMQDVVMSLLDEGCVAIVPIQTDRDPENGAFDITTMRVGKIVEWYPGNVRLSVYNEFRGQRDEITLSKSAVAIIENPFYAIMNEPNSTLQRLIRKLNLLDVIDEQSGSGKLDIVLQLPYVIKNDQKQAMAKERLAAIEQQLKGSKYGIAYIDGTEHITQLNRPAENNLMSQIEYLTNLLFSQLGITQQILDGSADEKVLTSYYSRTIEPIASAIVNEIYRKFLTKTARTQGAAIRIFRDPFKLVPVEQLAEIADKMTRNEIMSSNEIREKIGMQPVKDDRADQLINKNINHSGEEMEQAPAEGMDSQNPDQNGEPQTDDDIVEDLLHSLESQIDDIISNAISGEEEKDDEEEE